MDEWTLDPGGGLSVWKVGFETFPRGECSNERGKRGLKKFLGSS
jgi:hypothetical protein